MNEADMPSEEHEEELGVLIPQLCGKIVSKRMFGLTCGEKAELADPLIPGTLKRARKWRLGSKYPLARFIACAATFAFYDLKEAEMKTADALDGIAVRGTQGEWLMHQVTAPEVDCDQGADEIWPLPQKLTWNPRAWAAFSA